MSRETPPAAAESAPDQAVIEFGAEPPAPPRAVRRRRPNLPELARGLAADRRTVPVSAAVGAVALFASLVSEWQITVLDAAQFGESRGGNRPLAAGIADLGALGGGYVAGLFVLAGAVVLVLFGPAAGRRHVRLLGLAACGVLLALLAATGSALGDSSRAVSTIFTFDLEEDQITLTYGRGIWCAVVGVLAVLLALWLAGRHEPPEAPARAGTEDVEADGPPAGPVVWSWRRPGRDEAPDDEDGPDAPIDLTVSSTTPFTSRDEDVDKAARRDETP